MNFEIKVNDKLFLKIPKLEDAQDIYAVIDKDRQTLREWLGWVDNATSPENTATNIARRIDEFEKKEAASFFIYYENQWIGSVGFISIDNENKKGEIGYWLTSDFGGKGLMTECVKASIKYGFEELGLNRIEIKCNSKNTKSAAIPKRLGFTLEATLRQDHVADNAEGFRDTLIFGLLRSDK
jgi:ribosomal-protein-serine acetyltransferase